MGCIWYYRFWSDIPAINSLLLIGNLNGELLNSTTALWEWTDLLLLLPPVITLVIYVIVPFDSEPLNGLRQIKWWYSGIFVIVFLASQILFTRSDVLYYRSIGQNLSWGKATKIRLTVQTAEVRHDIFSNGWLISTLKSAWQTIRLHRLPKKLTEEEIKSIEDFTNYPHDVTLADSIARENVSKNVVMIVVESLNSFAITMQSGGKPIAPVMQSLIAEEGTVSSLNVVSQIGAGGSGDGQLILNTGLLPLSDFSAAILVGSRNTFPSLAKSLGKKSNTVIFGDDASCWNEYDTFQSYGFDTIHTNKEYQSLIGEYGGDGALLKFAAKILPTLPRPFFAELLTVSMHVPFDDKDVPRNLLSHPVAMDESLPPHTRGYLSMVNYFDTQLGIFIESLKKSGLYKDTILIIVSDHSQDFALPESENHADPYMTFIATNTGHEIKVERTVGQIDIFPTILELCGVGTLPAEKKAWKGLGISILNPGINSAFTPSRGHRGEAQPHLSRRQEEAFQISELILLSDYFSQYRRQ